MLTGARIDGARSAQPGARRPEPAARSALPGARSAEGGLQNTRVGFGPAPGTGYESGPNGVGRLCAPGSGYGDGPSVVAPVVLRHPTPSDHPAHREGAARGRPPPWAALTPALSL